jgi:hypothetical protein
MEEEQGREEEEQGRGDDDTAEFTFLGTYQPPFTSTRGDNESMEEDEEQEENSVDSHAFTPFAAGTADASSEEEADVPVLFTPIKKALFESPQAARIEELERWLEEETDLRDFQVEAAHRATREAEARHAAELATVKATFVHERAGLERAAFERVCAAGADRASSATTVTPGVMRPLADQLRATVLGGQVREWQSTSRLAGEPPHLPLGEVNVAQEPTTTPAASVRRTAAAAQPTAPVARRTAAVARPTAAVAWSSSSAAARVATATSRPTATAPHPTATAPLATLGAAHARGMGVRLTAAAAAPARQVQWQRTAEAAAVRRVRLTAAAVQPAAAAVPPAAAAVRPTAAAAARLAVRAARPMTTVAWGPMSVAGAARPMTAAAKAHPASSAKAHSGLAQRPVFKGAIASHLGGVPKQSQLDDVLDALAQGNVQVSSKDVIDAFEALGGWGVDTATVVEHIRSELVAQSKLVYHAARAAQRDGPTRVAATTRKQRLAHALLAQDGGEAQHLLEESRRRQGERIAKNNAFFCSGRADFFLVCLFFLVCRC